jgi:AcrR family transcriptional regulator
LSDAATRLFLERGFADVTVREIADAADVSTTTLMKHFPTKEALVFDLDDEIESSLVAAVAERSPKTSVLDALRDHLRARVLRVAPAHRTKFMKLVLGTPALSDYWQKMWMRHEHALARALAKDLSLPEEDLWCSAIAHFVLEAAALSERSPRPSRMLEVAFDILERGWQRSGSAGARATREGESKVRRETALSPSTRKRASASSKKRSSA